MRFFRSGRAETSDASGPAAGSRSDPSPDPAASADTETYRRYTRRILEEGGPEQLEEAMARAIGASSIEEFHRSGQMELDLLVQWGLRPDQYLVDVGCGSGRLTSKLAAVHTGRYLGTELSPELIEYARLAAPSDAWRFEVVEGLTIPEERGAADMVCFFSVLTHLRHEESYLYLEEACRVLAPGGKIVFSFLDFSQSNHRIVFEATVDAVRHGDDLHVNQFVSVDAIRVWAKMLGMEIEVVRGGARPHIALSGSPYYDTDETEGSLGQSVCVMVKSG